MYISAQQTNKCNVCFCTICKHCQFLYEMRRIRRTEDTIKNRHRSLFHNRSVAFSIPVGLEREELVKWFDDYMSNLPISERKQGLVSCNVESYSVQEVVIKKQYYASEDYHQFFMIYKNGRIVVYHSDQKTVYDYPDIYLYDLPLDIQCQINKYPGNHKRSFDHYDKQQYVRFCKS